MVAPAQGRRVLSDNAIVAARQAESLTNGDIAPGDPQGVALNRIGPRHLYANCRASGHNMLARNEKRAPVMDVILADEARVFRQ